MKTSLITGGAGFIGSNFVHYVDDKYPDYQIPILDLLTGSLENLPGTLTQAASNGRLQFWYGDVRNASLVDSLVAQSDVVVHFATETHVTRSIYDNNHFFETDVLGTQVVANSVLKHVKFVDRFIHISTSEVYGTARAPKMGEDAPLMPMSPHASAKAGADRLVYSYFHALHCLAHCDLGGPIRGEVITLGSERSISLADMAPLVARKMKAANAVIACVGDRPGQVFRHAADIAKAERLLGWRPRVSFEEGLDRTIAWYLANRAWWEKQLWMRNIPIITKTGKRELH